MLNKKAKFLFPRIPAILLSIACIALLTGCDSNSFRAEQAGKALAETSCMRFTEQEGEANAIYMKYGFSDSKDLNEYLESINGTTEFNEVAVSIRSHLKETCGENLEKLGIDPAEIYESILPDQ